MPRFIHCLRNETIEVGSVPDRESWSLNLGATVLNDGVRFRVWAPDASSMSLVLLEPPKTLRMDPQEKGYFTLFVKDLRPGARYFYRWGENPLRPDPASRFQPDGVHGPSEVVDPRLFSWHDQGWKGLPLDEMILYELHTGTFTQEGTFETIIPLIDYLKHDLGVTAIELMPIAQFPGKRNWGYDGAYAYAPQNSYGGPLGLMALVNACHEKGLAVVLDVVYNHLGPEGNYLAEYGPYFTSRYRTPWGSAVNYDGPRSDEVRAFIIGNALHWITEYHMDGLRLDAIHNIFDFSGHHILNQLSEAVQQQSMKLGRRTVITGESNLNDARIVESRRKGGYDLDAQWNDDFHHSLHTLLTGERMGYYEDFGDIHQLKKAIEEGFVYSGQYSPFRKRYHGSSSRHLPACKLIAFCQNHDQIGNRLKGERISSLVPFEALKLAAGLVLLSPALPLLFMGEEYGEDAPFLFFVSHSDPDLIESVRRGRREEFSVFRWQGEVPDPQAEETFLKSKIHLSLKGRGRHKSLLDFYRKLIKLRKEIPSLSHLSKVGTKVEVLDGKNGLIVRRRYNGDQTISIFNISHEPLESAVSIPRGVWKKLIDSGDDAAPESIESRGSKLIVRQSPLSFVLYRRKGHRFHLRQPKSNENLRDL